jgi:hypothetical protein
MPIGTAPAGVRAVVGCCDVLSESGTHHRRDLKPFDVS